MTKLLTFTKTEDVSARVGPLIGLDGQDLPRNSHGPLPVAAERPDPNPHLQQMRDVLIACRVSRTPLTTGQVETIEKLARAIYYGVIEYDGSYGGPMWEQASITIKTDYLKAATETIQGMAARCSQCGMPLWPGEETFCSQSCRRAAEME